MGLRIAEHPLSVDHVHFSSSRKLKMRSRISRGRTAVILFCTIYKLGFSGDKDRARHTVIMATPMLTGGCNLRNKPLPTCYCHIVLHVTPHRNHPVNLSIPQANNTRHEHLSCGRLPLCLPCISPGITELSILDFDSTYLRYNIGFLSTMTNPFHCLISKTPQ